MRDFPVSETSKRRTEQCEWKLFRLEDPKGRSGNTFYPDQSAGISQTLDSFEKGLQLADALLRHQIRWRAIARRRPV
jgi:hypothetical protein